MMTNDKAVSNTSILTDEASVPQSDFFDDIIKKYADQGKPTVVLIGSGNRAGLATLRERLRTMDVEVVEPPERLKGREFDWMVIDEISPMPATTIREQLAKISVMRQGLHQPISSLEDFEEQYLCKPIDRKAQLKAQKLQRERDRAKASRQRYPNKFNGRHL